MTFRYAVSVHLFLAVAALGAAACGDDSPTGPTPTEPVAITESFPADSPGTLTPNGGVTHSFGVQQAGQILVNLTSLAPDSTAVIGLSLGSWNGTSCSQTISNDKATQGTNLVGEATVTGNYCARVYDAGGQLREPVTYRLTVTHF